MPKTNPVTVHLADFDEVTAALAAGRRALEALRLIRAAGSGNSHVVAGWVAWGLGETDDGPPARTIPPPAPDALGEFLRRHPE